MAVIKIENKSYDLPSSWDQMSSKQFVDVIRAFIASTDLTSFKIKALFALLNMQIPQKPQHIRNGQILYAFKLKRSKIFLMTPEQFLDIIPKIDYLFNTDLEGEQTPYIVSNRTINPFPSFKHFFTRYYGPADKLINLSFEEFISAEGHYMNFLKDNNTMHLDSLLASLFRPQDPDYNPKHFEYKGDRREPFNDHLIWSRSRLFSKIDIAIKFATFYFFQGCREFLTYQFPHVFNSTGGNGKENKFGMMVLIDALAQNDVTKNDQIRKGSLFDILLHLEQASIHKLEMESKLKKH